MSKIIRPSTFARTLAKADARKTTKASLLAPSPNPATNLLIADIVLRGVASVMRSKIDKRVVKASYEAEEDAHHLLNGRTIITSLALYGVSKIATRSVPGLLIVTGSLVAKTLYDLGAVRQRRLRSDKPKD